MTRSGRRFAEQYGVRSFTDFSTLLKEAAPQAVILCTPHPLHAEPAIQAAEAGVHVLVEKPLAASLKDCDAMLAAADNAGVDLGVVSQRRFYEPVRLTAPLTPARWPTGSRHVPHVKLARRSLLSLRPVARPLVHGGRRRPRQPIAASIGPFALAHRGRLRKSAATGPTLIIRPSR